METDTDTGFHRIPGLYRLWDLQFVIGSSDDYRIHYAEMTEDRAPLFAVYCRKIVMPADPGCPQ